jgi:ornithine carbamoyltransferase
VARTLAQNFSFTAWRVRQHDVFSQAAAATGPGLGYINLLSNRSHPTQAIADVLTLAEHAGGLTNLAGTTVTYIGDAANVARSLAAALIRLGVHVRLSSPPGYGLDSHTADRIAAASRRGGSLTSIADPHDAVRGSGAIYCDAFVSMGDEGEREQRLIDLAPWRLDASLFAAAPDHAVVLHCLPAHRGEEITDDVLDDPRSLIWRQVAYRRHAVRGALRLIEEGRL